MFESKLLRESFDTSVKNKFMNIMTNLEQMISQNAFNPILAQSITS